MIRVWVFSITIILLGTIAHSFHPLCARPNDVGCSSLTTLLDCTEWSGCQFVNGKCVARTRCDEVKCGVRDIALRFSSRILPSCVRGEQDKCNAELDLVTLALKLDKECFVTDPYRMIVQKTQPHYVSEIVDASPLFPTIFVNPEAGSDVENDGLDRINAVRTIQRALDIIRLMSLSQKVRPTIVLMPGVHRLIQSITLSQADSGLTIQGETGAIVSGALDAADLLWTRISASTFAANISAIRDRLGPLSVLSYRGEPMVRARYPNKASYLDTNNFLTPTGIRFNPRPKQVSPFTAIYNRRVLMGSSRVLRYGDFVSASGGPCSGVFSPPAGFFCNLRAESDGVCAYSLPGSITLGRARAKAARVSSWTNKATGYLRTLHQLKWGGWTFQFARDGSPSSTSHQLSANPSTSKPSRVPSARPSLSPETSTPSRNPSETPSSFPSQGPSSTPVTSEPSSLASESPSNVQDNTSLQLRQLGRSLIGNSGEVTLRFSAGGFQEARGDCGRGGQDWYIENIRELADYPKEYFLDLARNLVYFVPPRTSSDETLDPSKFEIGSDLSQFIRVLGTSSSPVRDIRLVNIVFENSYPTHMAEHEVPSGGDWSLHRGGTVFLQGVENVTVADCEFRKLGANGIFVSNYARDVDIARNTFFGLDGSGILLSGDPKHDSLEPWNRTADEDHISHVVIRNNHIHDLGLVELQAAGIFVSIASNILIAGNVIYRGPRAAINLNDLFGGNHVTRHNLVFDMVRITKDHGPYNVWDRQQWFQPDNFVTKMNVFEENVFFGSSWGNKIVDLDGGSRDHIVRNNLCAYGYMKIKGGNIVAYNNTVLAFLPTTNQPWCHSICESNQEGAGFVLHDNVCFASAGNKVPYGWAPKAVNFCSRDDVWTYRNTFYGTTESLTRYARCGPVAKWFNFWQQDVGSTYVRALPPNRRIIDHCEQLVSMFVLNM